MTLTDADLQTILNDARLGVLPPPWVIVALCTALLLTRRLARAGGELATDLARRVEALQATRQ